MTEAPATWTDPEYALKVELDGERFRGRLVHRETKARTSVIGRFSTVATLERAARLQLAEKRLIAPHGPTADIPIPDDAHTEYAVLHLGDLHIGKAETDVTTWPARVQRITDRLIGLRTRMLRSYNITGLLIAITGDTADGANVYPAQSYNQSMPNPDLQVRLAGETLAQMALDIRPYYGGDVRIAGVGGNHGVAGKHAPQTQNYDIFILDRLADRLAGQIPVIYQPNEPLLPLRVPVAFGRSALLYHGHKKIGTNKSTAQTQIGRWFVMPRFGPFEYFLCGHLHHMESWEYNCINFFRCGTALTDDPHSHELGYESSTSAWLFGVHRERAVTWSVRLDLT